jgi:electron transfer flavoprotein beta subunit
MNIVVCIKQVLDPDLPARDFKIDPEKKEAVRGNANLVTNIFCENALETALQLKEAVGGDSKVTAICYGTDEAEDSLRKALAMTCDDAILVQREGSDNPDPDAVSEVLAAAVRHVGDDVDVVMVGRESGDWGVGQTGGLLAEKLGMPSLALVDTVTPSGDGLSLQRQTDVGLEKAEAQTPCLLLITNNENNVPRIPKTRDVMMSYRKPLTKLSLADLDLDNETIKNGTAYYEVVDLSVPEKNVECEFIEGDSIEERVDILAKKIHDIVVSVN